MEKAVAGIGIVRESEDVPSEQADKIHRLLSEAKVVCFLGFGYHKANVDRLHIGSYKGETQWFGSAFGLGMAEIRKASQLFPDGLRIGDTSSDIMAFLRSSAVFD